MEKELQQREKYRAKLSEEERMLDDLCFLVDMFPQEMRREVFEKACEFATPPRSTLKKKKS